MNLALLVRSLLRGPCTVTKVKAERFRGGHLMPDAVVVSHRLILVTSGQMDYTIDNMTMRPRAGIWFWVPAWSRRQWRARPGGCELKWVEFTADALTVPGGWHQAEPLQAKELGEIERRHARLLRDWTAEDDLAKLRQEAETKALAAEFWSRVRPREATRSRAAVHPETARARAWLEDNCLRADALDIFYRDVVALSPNHFRLLYRRQTGETVQETLARLRLRRARYLVVETALSIKEIAAACGFSDPLYFSSHYRRFWGVPPSANRGCGATA
jgi:AraC-like DNA-binding protein